MVANYIDFNWQRERDGDEKVSLIGCRVGPIPLKLQTAFAIAFISNTLGEENENSRQFSISHLHRYQTLHFMSTYLLPPSLSLGLQDSKRDGIHVKVSATTDYTTLECRWGWNYMFSAPPTEKPLRVESLHVGETHIIRNVCHCVQGCCFFFFTLRNILKYFITHL